MMKHIMRTITGAFGLASGLSREEVHMALHAMDMLLDRYHVKFNRDISARECEILAEQCGAFLEAHERVPTDQEIDAILDTYILH